MDTRPTEGSGGTRTRTSETHGRIRDDVVSGRLRPGSKLKIGQLSRAMGVGQTPVREALSSLASDGLVVREDQRGFRVAHVSASEFQELLNVRCFVEERALRLAIERGVRSWEEGIVLAQYRLQSHPPTAHYDAEGERLHRDFHLALLAGCGSDMLLRLSSRFFDENNRYRYLSRLDRSAGRNVAKEHEEIAQAALARDAESAVDRLIGHYQRTGDLLRDALSIFEAEVAE